MTTEAKSLRVGDRIALPELVCEHVIVIGPEWAPKEVWVSDPAGHVHTLDPHATVELIERLAS